MREPDEAARRAAEQAAYLAAASALLDLPVRAEDHAEVAAAFAVLAAHARVVAAFALPEDVEAAPRFVP